MKRTLTILAAIAVAFSMATASADTHLWLTTEGAGIAVSSHDRPGTPPPPPCRHHHNKYTCKECRKIEKQHRKEVKKMEKERRKALKKAHKDHHKNHHNHHHKR